MMRLTVVFNGEEVSRAELSGDSVTVGRSSECELVIDNAGVSRRHCQIVQQGKFHILEDLNSNNGTFIGGQLLTGPHVLNSGDEIGIGKHIIRFETDEEAPSLSPDGGGRGGAMGGAMTMEVDAADMIRMQLQRSARVKGYLSFLAGGDRRPVKLEKASYVIGTWEKADIPASGFAVAPKHAVIIREEVNYRILNFARLNRTRVNGQAIEQKVLNNGDQIQIGKIVMQFMAGEPSR